MGLQDDVAKWDCKDACVCVKVRKRLGVQIVHREPQNVPEVLSCPKTSQRPSQTITEDDIMPEEWLQQIIRCLKKSINRQQTLTRPTSIQKNPLRIHKTEGAILHEIQRIQRRWCWLSTWLIFSDCISIRSLLRWEEQRDLLDSPMINSYIAYIYTSLHSCRKWREGGRKEGLIDWREVAMWTATYILNLAPLRGQLM